MKNIFFHIYIIYGEKMNCITIRIYYWNIDIILQSLKFIIFHTYISSVLKSNIKNERLNDFIIYIVYILRYFL